MDRNRLNLRKVVAIAICLASSVKLFAQDIIVMKNGDEIQAVVQDVGIDDVKYKKFDNPDGADYTLEKSEIFMIKYENGSKDVFNEIAANASADKQQQSASSELSYNNGVWRNNVNIDPDQVREIMSGNSEALQKYNSGRSLFIVGQVIAYPSAFLLGWDLGARMGGGGGNGALLGVGLAGTAIGLIMAFSGESQMKTSVELYNSTAKTATSRQINFGLTQMGVGLCMKF